MTNDKLQQHREDSISALTNLLVTNSKVACVRPTGYGKTYMIKAIADANAGTKIIVVPQSTLADYLSGYFPNRKDVKIVTYQKLLKVEDRYEAIELFGKNVSFVFLDEMHRAEAEKWNDGVKHLLSVYPHSKLVGMYSISSLRLSNALETRGH